MKAIVFTQYGSPDVLKLQEVAKPIPADNEILVKVYAVATNPLDWRTMRADPFLARLENGLMKPKVTILGADIAGKVEAVGKDVTQFQPGDEVFGSNFQKGLGGFAEYVCMKEAVLALKPKNVSFEAAAAVPVAALTALQGLRDKGQIQSGQKVLINGASGGVGTFAIQIAKAYGAEVTGVCSTRNLELVRGIGADHVIDYTKEDFTRSSQRYDLIFDAVGNHSVSDYQRALQPTGRCVVAGFTSFSLLVQIALWGALISQFGSKKVGMMGNVQPNQKDLVVMKELMEAGRVIPVMDKTYPLSETAEAIRYLEQKHVRGKVVISVA